MKRKSLKFIACAVITAMTLSMTACGGSDAAPAAETEEATEAETETETEAEPEEAAEPEAETETEAEPEEAAEPETETEAEPEAEAEAEGDTAATGDTLESLLNDPAVKGQFETMVGSMAEDGMSVGMEAKGNELTVIIKIEDSSMIVDGMGEALGGALDGMASQVEEMAGQLDASVGGEAGTCTVVMRYLDPDDNVLAEKSFQAQ